MNGKVVYEFAGTDHTASDRLPLTWYDGSTPLPAEVIDLMENDEVPAIGSIFLGTQGAMRLPHIGRPMLYPYAAFEDFEVPAAGDVNHWGQFVDACRGTGSTTAGFAYAGPLTEAILVGCVASRFPRITLDWEARQLRFRQAEANRFVRRDYRRGRTVRGLS